MRDKKNLQSTCPDDYSRASLRIGVVTIGVKQMRTLFMSFWVINSVAIALVPACMLARKTFKLHPIFFVYVVYDALIAWVNFGLYNRAGAAVYFYAFWIATAGTSILGFAVLREIFLQIFRPYDSLRQFGDVLFRWAAVVLVMIAIVMAVTSNHQGISLTCSFLMTLNRSVLMMQCGLVIFMFLFAPHLGLTMRHHIFGIAIGFGISASVELVGATLFAYGVGSPHILGLIKMGADIFAAGLWAYYMMSPDPERRVASGFAHAQDWNYELNRLHHTPEAAFLPNIVDTVERVLSRRTATEIYMHSAGSGPSLPN